MKVTWLGQAGFLFENDNIKIIVDPYLSDSCFKVNPRLKRRYPIDEAFLKIKPDVIILTHIHLDHTDPETLDFYLKTKSYKQTMEKFGITSKNGLNFIIKSFK